MNKNYFALAVPIKTIKAFCFLMLTCLAISISTYGQVNRVGSVIDYFDTPTSSGVFKAAAGVTSLNIQCWGAGGGGGGSTGLLGLLELGAASGGGGGGAFSSNTFNINPPTPANPIFNYIVGQGGAGGSTDGVNGVNGNGSSFKNATATFTVEAGGGSGGQGSVLITGAGAGLGATVGDYKGGNGGAASFVVIHALLLDTEINRSGGGGGSAGPGLNGLAASGVTGGASVTGGAAGGNGGEKTRESLLGVLGGVLSLVVSDNIQGSPGGFPGGGGGGGVGNGLVNGLLGGLFNPANKYSNGGKGGDGQISVNYTCPTYSVTGSSTDASCTQTNTITLTGNLPIGTYDISYTISSGSEVTVPMVVSTAGTGNITVVGIPIVGSSTVTITKIKSEGCWTTVNFSILFDRPVKPIIDTTTHPSCAEPKGTVVLSNLVIGGTIYQTGVSSASYPITENPQTITGLDSGNYNFIVSNGVCSSQTVSDVTDVSINNPPPTITWNGAWDGVPTLENKVIFAQSYNDDPENLDENVNIEACSCEVNLGAHVTFKTGRYLKIRNELIVDAGGFLTFENDASLVQMNDDSESLGNIIYKRHTEPVKRYDFTYWSSPVEEQTLKDLSPYTLGDKYYSYVPNQGWQIHYNGNQEMFPVEGYIIRAPQSFSITMPTVDEDPTFVGKPNNGRLTKNLTAGLVYLIGNPYPSAMSADAFLTENAAKLQGTLYFWTHNSPPSINVDGDAIYNYTTNDYATYNLTGGVGTRAAINDDDVNDPDDNFNDSVPNGNIAAAQGFFAPASEMGGEIVFNNAMRLLDDEVIDDGEEYDEVRDNSQFFKLGTTSKAKNALEKNRLWLNLSNAQGAFKQTLIGYITGATNGYEGNFDGVSYDGNQYLDFYSINQGLNLAIQGRDLAFQEKDTVVLGYKTAIAGEFKISIGHVDGSIASKNVFLEDKLMQVLHDLKEPYTFVAEKGIFKDRFVLRYQDKTAVIEDDIPVEGVLIATNDKVITINTAEEVIEAVYIYDFSGELVYSDTIVDTVGTTISNLSVAHPALIVQVVLANGKKAVKKIIY